MKVISLYIWPSTGDEVISDVLASCCCVTAV